jgi:hypothetical protein
VEDRATGGEHLVVDYGDLFVTSAMAEGVEVAVDWDSLVMQMDYLAAMQLCLCVTHAGLEVNAEAWSNGSVEGILNAMGVSGSFEVGGVCHSCEVGRIGWDGKCGSCGHNESAHEH